MEATIKAVKNAIATMNELKTSEGYVVETAQHVRVIGEGLNKTGFNVKCPITCEKAVIYASEEEAQNKGYNDYLIDGRNTNIRMRSTKASVFFDRSIQQAEEILLILNANI